MLFFALQIVALVVTLRLFLTVLPKETGVDNSGLSKQCSLRSFFKYTGLGNSETQQRVFTICVLSMGIIWGEGVRVWYLARFV